MKQYEPNPAKLYRDTESGEIWNEVQIFNEWQSGNYDCSFTRYLLDCTSKNGFLEEVREGIIYRNERGFVKKTRLGSYEVYTHGARNLDGIYEEGTHLEMTYGENYWRDWLGRSGSIYYEFDPLKAAIDYLNPTR